MTRRYCLRVSGHQHWASRRPVIETPGSFCFLASERPVPGVLTSGLGDVCLVRIFDEIFRPKTYIYDSKLRFRDIHILGEDLE